MMEDDHTQKWMTILFFSISGIVFGISLYLITAGASAPARTDQAWAASPAIDAASEEPQLKVMLERDKPTRLGSVDLIYRGIRDRKLRLDVIMLELDPEYAYRRAIALEKAHRGFRMGGIGLKLITAEASRAKIVWERKG